MSDQKSHIAEGIASFAHQQKLILRVLRKRGHFTSVDFDKWFRGPCAHRSYRRRPLFVRDSDFILGGLSFCPWAWWLELVQCMMALDMVDCVERNGVFTYSLPPPAP